MNKRTWGSKWWKGRRKKLVKTICEICDSQEPPFTLQHTWQPPKYFDIINSYIRQHGLQWEGSKQQEARNNIENLSEEELSALDAEFLNTEVGYKSQIRRTCPICKRISTRYRKIDNKYICKNCNNIWDEGDLGFTAIKVIPYLKKKYWAEFQEARKLFNDDILANVPKEVAIKYLQLGLRYLSLEDTITACKSCSYRMDHPKEYNLCPKCKKRYKKIDFPTCFDCAQGG